MKDKKDGERTAKRAVKAKQTHNTAADSNAKRRMADGGPLAGKESSRNGDTKVIEDTHRPFGVRSCLLTMTCYG